MNEWQAVVFDLDDTLYPEKDFVLSGFRAVANWASAQFNIEGEQAYRELSTLYKSGIRARTFDLWLENHGFTTDLLTQMVQIYRQHTPCLTPFPATLALLPRLTVRYKLGLVSDGYLDVQRRKWQALGLNPFFDAVVFSDEFGRHAWKPNSYPFQVVLQRLAISPVHAVYIADNPLKDFIGARQIGMHTIRIKGTDGEYSHLEPPSPEYAPDETFKNLAQLETLFS